jgi:hypothetical protein
VSSQRLKGYGETRYRFYTIHSRLYGITSEREVFKICIFSGQRADSNSIKHLILDRVRDRSWIKDQAS